MAGVLEQKSAAAGESDPDRECAPAADDHGRARDGQRWVAFVSLRVRYQLIASWPGLGAEKTTVSAPFVSSCPMLAVPERFRASRSACLTWRGVGPAVLTGPT